VRLIIFDFDGVVADSEVLANQVLAEGLTAIGLPTTLEDSMRLYMGRRWGDCVEVIEAQFGGPLPEGFIEQRRERAHERLMQEIAPVAGVQGFLQRFAHVPRCIASSSQLGYIGQCLDLMGLTPWFEHRFSGHDVERGKPHPDLFLKAAATLGAAPGDCVVIEDSPMGVMAGRSAGMLTIGLCAGTHVTDGHGERLTAAGADHVAASYEAVARLLEPMFAQA
jgi:HAD superfamily hydrolase (TIGR01509 family)